MSGNFVVNVGSGLLKLALFAALVALGIVFVPDGFMERVDRGVAFVGDYLQGEVAKRAPGAAQEVSKQAQETKGDLQQLYTSLKDKYSPVVSRWVAGWLAPKGR